MLGNLERIIHLVAQISHGALELAVPEQQLTCPPPWTMQESPAGQRHTEAWSLFGI